MRNYNLGHTIKGMPYLLNYKYLNRHALVTGSTGSGKTNTIKRLIEVLHNEDIATLTIDIKQDISSILNDKQGCLYDFKGLQGTKLSADIKKLGVNGLSTLFDLTIAQSDVMAMVLLFASDNNRILWTLDDLQRILKDMLYMLDTNDRLISSYGYIQKSTIRILTRKVNRLILDNNQYLFDRQNFDIQTFIDNKISILDASELYTSTAYPALMLYMLRLCQELPEIGDIDKPKLVLVIDEAHTLFKNRLMTKEMIQIVKLIRSKGIGLIFVSQKVSDIPRDIVSQLSLKIQHQINAYTIEDMQEVKANAKAFSIELQEIKRYTSLIPNLNIGQAIIQQKELNGKPVTQIIQIELSESHSNTITPNKRLQTLNWIAPPEVPEEEEQLTIEPPEHQTNHARIIFITLLIVWIMYLIYST